MQLRLYLDDATTPFAEVANGSRIGFDTTDLPDGRHTLRIETVEDGRVTGQRRTTFTVRNGPGIAVAGLSPGDEVRGKVKLVINASDAGIDGRFDAHSMETHRGIPFFMGIFAAVVILACAAYLATDPFRFRVYSRQAEDVAALLDRAAAPGQALAVDAGSEAAGAPPPTLQELHLAEGAFLPLTEVENLRADATRGAALFAARCAGCHGAAAEGTIQEKVTLAGGGVYPRLAGQDRAYLVRQLNSFVDGWRDSVEMLPMARSLSDQDRLDVAAHIEGLTPPYPPRQGADPAVLARGKAIVELGVPDAGVARCSGCHGHTGRGGGANFPYLAGQWPDYIEAQLEAWRAGSRRNSWRGLMRPAAAGLTDAEITAVAAYLGDVRPAPGARPN
jgi:cytochrome c553